MAHASGCLPWPSRRRGLHPEAKVAAQAPQAGPRSLLILEGGGGSWGGPAAGRRPAGEGQDPGYVFLGTATAAALAI